MSDSDAVAWLVKECPNFFFMPSFWHDQIFTQYHDDGSKRFPEYWKTRGFEVFELVSCNELEASHWLINNCYGVFSIEAAQAARELGKTVSPTKLKGCAV